MDYDYVMIKTISKTGTSTRVTTTNNIKQGQGLGMAHKNQIKTFIENLTRFRTGNAKTSQSFTRIGINQKIWELYAHPYSSYRGLEGPLGPSG